MKSHRPITLLHISDPQFGRNHRFGRLGLPSPDDDFDNLLTRIGDDLRLLRRDHDLRPGILVVTGDLAEWGRSATLEPYIGRAPQDSRWTSRSGQQRGLQP